MKTDGRDFLLANKIAATLALVGCVGGVSLKIFHDPALSSLISNSPKETIDETWQIVYRDYLSINQKYDPDKWKKIRLDVLGKNYGSAKEGYEAIRGMLSTLDDPYTRFLDPVSSRRCRSILRVDCRELEYN